MYIIYLVNGIPYFPFKCTGNPSFFCKMSISVDRKAKTEGNLHQSDNVALGDTTNWPMQWQNKIKHRLIFFYQLSQSKWWRANSPGKWCLQHLTHNNNNYNNNYNKNNYNNNDYNNNNNNNNNIKTVITIIITIIFIQGAIPQ